MNYTQSWLEDPASIKGILVEATVKDILGQYGVAGSEVVIYLSSVGYTSSDASVSYLPYLTGNIQTTESLSIDGSLSMSFGDIELNNPNGDLDDWLDSTKFVWVNRPIQIYLGDPRWSLLNLAAIHDTAVSGFEKIFDGIIADIDSSSRESLNLKVRDKLNRLNEPVTDVTLGTYGTWVGGQTNQDSIRPLIFGEVFNISPMLVDPPNLEYMFNAGNTEAILEVRDTGGSLYTDPSVYTKLDTPISNVIVDLVNGKFKLKQPAKGTITASVQGVKNSINLDTGALVSGTYVNNIANLVALIVTQYGPVASRLSASDLDLANLKAFSINSNNLQLVGLNIADRTNILNACQELLASTNAQLFMTRKGLLQLLQLGTTTSDASVNITDRDILHHSLQISNRTEVIAATKIGYCRNYTPQTALISSLPAAHNVMFNDEWYSTTVIDETVKTNYKLDSSPIQKDTALIKSTDAVALATRLNNYFKAPKTVYSFTGTSTLLSLKLGQAVVLTHNRFGLNLGKSGQVISLSPNWQTGTINVEVII